MDAQSPLRIAAVPEGSGKEAILGLRWAFNRHLRKFQGVRLSLASVGRAIAARDSGVP